MLTEPQEVLQPTSLSREENTDHLLTENMALQRKVRELKLQRTKLRRCTFSVDTIHKSSFKFCTGLQSKEQFEALFKHTERNAECTGMEEKFKLRKGSSLSANNFSWCCIGSGLVFAPKKWLECLEFLSRALVASFVHG